MKTEENGTSKDEDLATDTGVATNTGSELDHKHKRRFVLREEEAEVVRPVVERAILLSGQLDRRILGRALSPVIGSAWRRSLTRILKKALIGLNRFFVLNFSADGIRWRFEAFRTGKPFRQVVQEHSLMCPVSQVFLIHRRTGLLIKQVQQSASDVHDGDMVSGMLTAIQDFVHDSFRSEGSGQLEVIRVGNVTVLLEQGPLAILAGIISQGFTPQSLRKTFRRVLEQIGDDYHKELVDFNGDSSGFDDIDPLLEECLKTRIIMGEDRISPMTGVVLLVPIVLAGVFGYFGWQQHIRWKNYLQQLSKEPGIVVVETGWKGLHREIRGLRDPLAADPQGLLLDAGIAPDDVRSEWHLYHSLCQEVELKRVLHILKPPPTVKISLHNGIVSMEGTAPWNWVELAPSRIMNMSGITRVKTEGIRQTGIDQKLAWNQYLAKIAELPGILVLKQGRGRDHFYISGMRDAMAPDPLDILKASGLDTNQVISHWEPFQALHPSLIIARAKRMLEPPHGVQIKLQGNVLVLEGSASHSWIAEARLVTRGIAGISKLDTSNLVDTDIAKLKSLTPIFDKYVFYYLSDNHNLWPGQETRYKNFLKSTTDFAKIVRKLGGGYHIEIRGHVLATGNTESDMLASEELATRFYNKLRTQQVDINLFTKRGMGGVPAPVAAEAEARRREAHISFKIVPDE